MDHTLGMVRRIERAHRCLSRCNRLTIRGLDEADLVQRMCDLAVAEAGYRLAWVGYAEHDAERWVRPVAQSGYEAGYLESIRISWGDNEWSRGPTGIAIRTGQTSVAQNLRTTPAYAAWREQAVLRGYASSVALPLREGGVAFGALNLYAGEPDAFDSAELELLDEMADDLAHGILHARGVVRLSALEQALRRSERLDTVGRVAAGIAHDVNNLLTVIMGATDELRQIAAPGAARDIQQPLRDIEDAVDRAGKLNRELLCFARRAPNRPVEFEVDPYVRSLWNLLARSLRLPHTVTLDAAGATVHLDVEGFERVLTNLVMNAHDAMPDGGQLTIRTAVRDLRRPMPAGFVDLVPGTYVSLSVEDTGIGMSETVMQHLFEPFFTTKPDKGTGLGLATAFGIVRQAGGGIAVTSVVGKGTTFEVLLPRVTGT